MHPVTGDQIPALPMIFRHEGAGVVEDIGSWSPTCPQRSLAMSSAAPPMPESARSVRSARQAATPTAASRWTCKPAWAEQMPSEGGIYRTRAEHVVQNHCSAADHTGLIAVRGRQNS
jgi:hypothetical protein